MNQTMRRRRATLAVLLTVGIAAAGGAAGQDGSAGWTRVGGTAAVDSLLLAGDAVLLAFEDTLRFDPGEADTVQVTASRVTLEEIVAAIGERMVYDNARLENYEYTSLVTQVLRDAPLGEDGDYAVEEYALRYRHDRDLGDQVVTLWQRKRKFEDGRQVEDEAEDKMELEILPVQERVFGAMPFAPGEAHRYRYEIEDRQLVGNNLIYRISFAPKSRFEALPSGTIWVDCTNWVMRKVEARLTDAVPYPMFLEAIPVVRFSQERFGDYWFPSYAYMRVDLRAIPFVPMPDNFEVRVRMQDVVINGVPRSPADAVPDADAGDLTADELAGGFWLTPEANADTLAAFWSSLDTIWAAEATSDLGEVTLDMARIDSLANVGAARLTDIRTGSHWRFEADPLRTPGYNRTQGFVVRAGATVSELGVAKPRLDLVAGYAFAKRRPVFGVELDLPLVVARRTLADPTSAGRRVRGNRYAALALEVAGRKGAALFAGDGRRHTRSFTAFAYGSDPNHYYEERSVAAALRWKPAQGLALSVGGGLAEHRPWAQETSWNVLGRRLRPDGNRQAAALDDRFLSAGAAWDLGVLRLDGGMTWHETGAAGSGGGEAALREWSVRGELDLLDGLGNQWVLRGAHRAFDAPAPVQWRTWLGDWGTLRGYRAGELAGDAGAHASLDARLGVDVWRALRVPVLRHWGLQPLGFVDWGKTWDAPGGVAGPDEGARDWRMDVGFGFGRRFDVPGLGEFRNLRVYAAHGVARGSEGEGWRVLVGFEK